MTIRTISEPARQIPIVEDVDVVVVGGGTAGMPAAVAAARNGARTALVERWGYVGGAAVGGLVLTVPEKAGIWGIEREFYGELEPLGGVAWGEWITNETWAVISAPISKHLADVFLQRHHIVPLYHSWCAGVDIRDGHINAVIVENKSGRQAIAAKVVIDATGDGDVAHLAGALTVKGDAHGRLAPVTTMYTLANADAKAWNAVERPWEQAVRPCSALCETRVNPGEFNCWGGSIEGDGADVRELTRLEIELRAAIMAEFVNVRKLPGMAQTYISCIAEQMGVRETRRIIADVMLTAEDGTAGRVFDDTIGKAYTFTVPYRSLIPQRLHNVLAAGRCIGCDHAVHDKIRIVPVCFTTGQAAGTAAALAAKADGDVRKVDVARLQAILAEQGVDLGR